MDAQENHNAPRVMYEQPKIIVYVFRLTPCPMNGLKMEDVVHTQYEEDVFNYSKAKIGQLINRGAMSRGIVTVPDMNGYAVPGEREGTLVNAVRIPAIMPTSVVEDFTDWIYCADCFEYAPYGSGASSIGFFSDTVAWIYPHRDRPVFMYKRNTDENVYAVQKFLEHMSDIPALPPWPVVPKEKSVITPFPPPSRLRHTRAMARRMAGKRDLQTRR